MIYLFLELPFSTQLEKINPESLEECLADLEKSAKDKTAEFRQIGKRVWLWAFPHIKAAHTQVAVQGIQLIRQRLAEWSQVLTVFHGLIAAAENLQQALAEFEHCRLVIPRQNQIWMEKNAAGLLRASLTLTERDNGLWELSNSGIQPATARIEPETEFDEVFTWFEKAGPSRVLVLEGPPEDCRRTVSSVLAGLNDQPHFVLNGIPDEQPVYQPLVRAVLHWGESYDLGELSPILGRPRDPSMLLPVEPEDFPLRLSRWMQGPLAEQLHKSGATVVLESADRMQPQFLRPLISWLFSLAEYRTGMRILMSAEDSPRFRELLSGSTVVEVRSHSYLGTGAGEDAGSGPISGMAPDSGTGIVAEPGSVARPDAGSGSGYSARHSSGAESGAMPDSGPHASTRPDFGAGRRSRVLLDEPQSLVAEICAALGGSLYSDHVLEIAEAQGINKLLVPQIMQDLAAKAVLVSGDWPLSLEGRTVRSSVQVACAGALLALWRSGRLCLSRAEIPLVCAWAEDWLTLLQVGYASVLSGNIVFLQEMAVQLERRAHSGRGSGGLYEGISRLFRAEVALRNGELEEAERGLLALERIVLSTGRDVLDAYRKLLAARIAFSQRRLDSAVQEVKAALVLFQNAEEEFGRFLGMNLYGSTVFAKNRLQEAKEYFQIATRQAEDIDLPWIIELSRVFELQANLGQGYFSRILNQFGEDRHLGRSLRNLGLARWARTAAFILGRVQFLLGDYEAALETFTEEAEADPAIGTDLTFRSWSEAFLAEDRRWGALCQIWADRTAVHLNPSLRGARVEAESFPEQKYFEAEAAALRQDFDAALEVLDRQAVRPPTSIVPWRPIPAGGFVLIEDLYIGSGVGHTVLENLELGLRGYVLARLGQLADGVDLLFELNRRRTLAAGDPYMPMYLAWYETVLELLNNTELEASVEDHNTVLGRAIKAMQERSAKIEDPAHRRFYLSREITNKALIQKGRSHNLI